jgi:hypothetical protein
MTPRLKLEPGGAVYERDYSAPGMASWQRLGGEGFDPDLWGCLTDDQVADWPDLVSVITLAPPIDPDRMVAEIVAAANEGVDSLVSSFLPPLRVDYRQGTPGEWNVSACIAPRGHTPRFARVTDPSLLTALVKLHAKVVTGDAPDA